MIKTKKLFKKSILMLFAFLSIITALTIPSFAYSEDSNGNLVSSNLFDYNKISSDHLSAVHSVTFGTSSKNGAVVFDVHSSQDNDPFIYFHDIVTLPSGTYSWSFNSNAVVEQIGFTPNNSTNFDISRIKNASSGSNTFTLSSETTLGFGFEFLRENNTSITIMLNSGSIPLPYEPYGVTYYSEENYNNALLDNYGIFRLCSSIKLTLTWTDGSNKIVTYSWDSILSLINDKNYVNCVNGVFNYSNQALSKDYLHNTYSATAMWQFNFNGVYPLVKQYPYMLGSGYVSRYQIVDNKGSLFAYDSFPNDSSYIDLTQYQNKQIGYIQLYTGPVGAGSAVDTTSLYFDNSYDVAYTRGYEDGKQNGYDDGRDYGEMIGYENGKNDGYDLGYNKGVKDGESSDFATNGFKTLIGSIFNFPINMIRSVFNFDFMGINIATLITFIISIVIVIFIVKKFKK